MALPAYALVSLAELKSYMPSSGTAKDDEMDLVIARASREIEEHVDRRLVYRAPTESAANIVASAAIASGALTVLGGQPTAGRTLVVTKTDANRSVTGLLTITGTVDGVAGTTETFDLGSGDVLHGLKMFTAVSAAALTGVLGAAAGDTLTVGTSTGYTEFHSPYEGASEIAVLEWPVTSVIEVNEDTTLTFGSSTALAAVTSYEIREMRRIARVSGKYAMPFLTGHRAIRIRYAGGYKTTTVPSPIKDVCLELASWSWHYAKSAAYGLVTRSEAGMGVTYTGPPMITPGMKNRLAPFIRGTFETTGERDFDLEAA